MTKSNTSDAIRCARRVPYSVLLYELAELITKYNVSAANQPRKPPLEGVYLSRRLHREN